jgi:hypothetical protein
MKKPMNALTIIYVGYWLPFVTILRVYNIKEYNKNLCVVNLSKIWISKILDVTKIKWLKVYVCRF